MIMKIPLLLWPSNRTLGPHIGKTLALSRGLEREKERNISFFLSLIPSFIHSFNNYSSVFLTKIEFHIQLTLPDASFCLVCNGYFFCILVISAESFGPLS